MTRRSTTGRNDDQSFWDGRDTRPVVGGRRPQERMLPRCLGTRRRRMRDARSAAGDCGYAAAMRSAGCQRMRGTRLAAGARETHAVAVCRTKVTGCVIHAQRLATVGAHAAARERP